MNQEQGFSKLDFQQGVEDISIEARQRFYTYTAVSYASKEEIQPLLSSAKEWAYIIHDKDVDSEGQPRGDHYHILLAFEQKQTYKKLLKLVDSKQNTFIQGVKRCVGNIMDYFTHSTKASENKAQYDEDDIVYSDKDYWSKRMGWKSAEMRTEEGGNEAFIEDLLSLDFDEVAFARKYGKDFIKHRIAYMDFRLRHCNDDLNEIKEINPEAVELNKKYNALKKSFDLLHSENEQNLSYIRELNSKIKVLVDIITVIEKKNQSIVDKEIRTYAEKISQQEITYKGDLK